MLMIIPSTYAQTRYAYNLTKWHLDQANGTTVSKTTVGASQPVGDITSSTVHDEGLWYVDLSSLSGTVTTCTLKFNYVSDASAGYPTTLNIHRIYASWSETATSPSYNNRISSTSWPSRPYGSSLSGSITLNGWPSGYGWKTVNTTALKSCVQNWIDTSSTNKGFEAYGTASTVGVQANISTVSLVMYITTPADPLRVNATTPANGATGVLTNTSKLIITFNSNMNRNSVSNNLIIKDSSGTLVTAYTLITGNNVSSITLGFIADTLSCGETYYITNLSSTSNVNNITLGTNHGWSFTTEDCPVIDPLRVNATTPANGAIDVSTNTSQIVITFNSNMNRNSVSNNLIIKDSSGTLVTAYTLITGNNVSSITLGFIADTLSCGETYYITNLSSTSNVNNITLGTNHGWSFTTEDCAGYGCSTISADYYRLHINAGTDQGYEKNGTSASIGGNNGRGSGNNYVREILCDFDVSSLKGNVTSATLRFNYNAQAGYTGWTTKTVHAYDQNKNTWTDNGTSTPSYNTFASTAWDTSLGTVDVARTTTGWYEITNSALKSEIQEWIDTSASNMGIVLGGNFNYYDSYIRVNSVELKVCTAAPPADPLRINTTTPADGATGVLTNTSKLIITFNSNMNRNSVSNNLIIKDSSGSLVTAYTLITGNNISSITLGFIADTLSCGETYYITNLSSTSNVNNITLGTNHGWSFTTEDCPLVDPLRVNATIPANGATDVSTNTSQIVITFNSNMNRNSVSNNLIIKDSSGSLVTAYTLITGNNVSSITLGFIAGTITCHETYYITNLSSTSNVNNITLSTNHGWSFTTENCPGDPENICESSYADWDTGSCNTADTDDEADVTAAHIYLFAAHEYSPNAECAWAKTNVGKAFTNITFDYFRERSGSPTASAHFRVYTSSNGSSWTQTYDETISPASGSGTGGSITINYTSINATNHQYLKFEVSDQQNGGAGGKVWISNICVTTRGKGNYLSVISTSPYDGEANVSTNLSYIVITFNSNMNPASVSNNLVIYDGDGSLITSYTLITLNNVSSITLGLIAGTLTNNMDYFITNKASTSNANNVTLGSPYTWFFTTYDVFTTCSHDYTKWTIDTNTVTADLYTGVFQLNIDTIYNSAPVYSRVKTNVGNYVISNITFDMIWNTDNDGTADIRFFVKTGNGTAVYTNELNETATGSTWSNVSVTITGNHLPDNPNTVIFEHFRDGGSSANGPKVRISNVCITMYEKNIPPATAACYDGFAGWNVHEGNNFDIHNTATVLYFECLNPANTRQPIEMWAATNYNALITNITFELISNEWSEGFTNSDYFELELQSVDGDIIANFISSNTGQYSINISGNKTGIRWYFNWKRDRAPGGSALSHFRVSNICINQGGSSPNNALIITAHSPTNNQTDVATNLSKIIITFNSNMNRSSVSNNFSIHDSSGSLITSYTLITGNNVSSITLGLISGALSCGETYYITNGAMTSNANNITLGSNHAWSFSTVDCFNGPFYVSKSGNDANYGSRLKPFLTIARAIAAMGTTTINTTYIGPGVYAEQCNVTNQSGTAASPIVFTASNDTDRPTIDGTTNCWNLNSDAVNYVIIEKMTNTKAASNAIRVNESDNIILRYNTCKSNVNAGILINGTALFIGITNNICYSNKYAGIAVIDNNADGTMIVSNTCWGIRQMYGIIISNADNSIIRDNQSHNHTEAGILLTGSVTHCGITNNTIYSNATAGIKCFANTAQYNTITSNTIYGGNQFDGITINDSDNINILYNSIHNNNDYGINITGSATYCGITNNQIYSNTSAGIYCNDDNADNNIFVSNTIYGGNQNAGIFINNSDGISILQNRIYKNTIRGITITGSAMYCGITNNTIYSNASTGIYCNGDNADNNTFVSNTIYGGNQPIGINIFNSDNIAVLHNHIYKNRDYGITINGTATHCGITNNTIYSNASAGIYCDDDNADNNMVVSNIIYGGNQNAGILIKNCDGISILRNRIYKHSDTGINIYGSATYCGITNNTIYSNTSTGIYCHDEGADNNTFMSNIIYGSNQSIGISVIDSDAITILQNRIYKNTIRGIQIYGSATYCGITNNIVYSNTSAGIFCNGDNADNNTIVSNTLYGGNQNDGISILDSDAIAVLHNHIYKHRDYGIHISGSATYCGITNNIVYSNTSAGIFCNGDDADNNTFVSNTIYGGNQNDGISIRNSDAITILQNRIYKNTIRGIQIYGSATYCGITNNTIYSNASAGIYCHDDNADNNIFVSNTIYGGNQPIGINIFNSDAITILQNRIYKNTIRGIHISGSATYCGITNNTIYSNTSAGIYCSGDNADNNTFVSNTIYGGNQNDGISILDSDAAAVLRNLIYNNSANGINIHGSATGIILVHNTIASNTGDGIEVANTATAFMTNSIIAFNNTYGINDTSSGVTEDYNVVYSNTTADYNGVVSIGVHSISNAAPYIFGTDYTIANSASSAVDAGFIGASLHAPYNNAAPDCGYRESSFARSQVSVKKSFTVTGPRGTARIPGATLHYAIEYDNDGAGEASGLIIQDILPAQVTYVSNSATDYLVSSNTLHTSASTAPVVWVSSDGSTWYQESTGTLLAAQVKYIRWVFSTNLSENIGVHDNSESTDTNDGTVNGDIPDSDAGRVRIKCTID